MIEAESAKEKTVKKPRRRHRAIRDELWSIGRRKREAAASREGAREFRPGRRYHVPEGRRAGLRTYCGLLHSTRKLDSTGSSGKGRGR